MNLHELARKWAAEIHDGNDPTRLGSTEEGRAMLYPPDGTPADEYEDLLTRYQTALGLVTDCYLPARTSAAVRALIALELWVNAERRKPNCSPAELTATLEALWNNRIRPLRGNSLFARRSREMYGYHGGGIYETLAGDFGPAANLYLVQANNN